MNAWRHVEIERVLARDYYTWQLDRPPAPALPASYFSTWDHSCNWQLDDPGIQNSGCYNRHYALKHASIKLQNAVMVIADPFDL